MVVIPLACRVAAVVTMMKNMIIWEKNIPMTVSRFILTIPRLVTQGLLAPMSGIRPSATSSSTSSDACQKNRYGEIVVPRIATMLSRKAAEISMCGISVA
ncbi:MAG: hypothetical protein PHP55_02295 [Methanoculleus sp.]|jgi:hypothetical protein|nr:hypothetical protein [Methanoculleus sp. UBA303]MDD3932665.1 hypothetical protein [Methanoculleus sp.]